MSKIGQWFNNARSASLVQSIMPSVLAAVMASCAEGFNIWFAILATLGVGAAHLAMNLADDWFDYRVDMKGDRDRVIRKGFRAMTHKYPYLTDGSQTLRTTAYAIAQFIVVALACGATVFQARTAQNGFCGPDGSWWIVAIVAACAFLGVFYSAPPFKLAYHGLGEPVIGVIFGPLAMMGVYYSACGSVDLGIVMISIPVGLLVLNILFTHSFIDLPSDAESNKMTFARLIGSTKGNLAASALFMFLPFVMIVTAVCMGELHPIYLITLIATPRAAWLFNSLLKFSKGEMMSIPNPPKWLGPMPKGWDKICEMKIDWFIARWICARNLLSAFCLTTILARIILLVIQ